VLKLTKTAY